MSMYSQKKRLKIIVIDEANKLAHANFILAWYLELTTIIIKSIKWRLNPVNIIRFAPGQCDNLKTNPIEYKHINAILNPFIINI